MDNSGDNKAKYYKQKKKYKHSNNNSSSNKSLSLKCTYYGHDGQFLLKFFKNSHGERYKVETSNSNDGKKSI